MIHHWRTSFLIWFHLLKVSCAVLIAVKNRIAEAVLYVQSKLTPIQKKPVLGLKVIISWNIHKKEGASTANTLTADLFFERDLKKGMLYAYK